MSSWGNSQIGQGVIGGNPEQDYYKQMAGLLQQDQMNKQIYDKFYADQKPPGFEIDPATGALRLGGMANGGPVDMTKGGSVPTAKGPGIDKVPALLDAPPDGPAEFVVPGDTVQKLDDVLRQSGYKGGLDDFIKQHHDFDETQRRREQDPTQQPDYNTLEGRKKMNMSQVGGGPVRLADGTPSKLFSVTRELNDTPGSLFGKVARGAASDTVGALGSAAAPLISAAKGTAGFVADAVTGSPNTLGETAPAAQAQSISPPMNANQLRQAGIDTRNELRAPGTPKLTQADFNQTNPHIRDVPAELRTPAEVQRQQAARANTPAGVREWNEARQRQEAMQQVISRVGAGRGTEVDAHVMGQWLRNQQPVAPRGRIAPPDNTKDQMELYKGMREAGMPSDVIADTIRQAQQVGVLPAMLGRDMAGEQEVVTSHNFFAKNDVAKLAELVAANPNLLVDDPANPGQKVSARALLRRETAKHTGELVR